MTTGVLFVSERLKRKHPQMVMWTLTALNCTYAAVVTHNDAVHASIHPGRN